MQQGSVSKDSFAEETVLMIAEFLEKEGAKYVAWVIVIHSLTGNGKAPVSRIMQM